MSAHLSLFSSSQFGTFSPQKEALLQDWLSLSFLFFRLSFSSLDMDFLFFFSPPFLEVDSGLAGPQAPSLDTQWEERRKKEEEEVR